MVTQNKVFCFVRSRVFFSILFLIIFSQTTFAQQPPVAATASKAVEPSAPVDSVATEKLNSTALEHTKISLDFKDADIGTVLRVISLKSGVNIVSGPEVVGVVTIRLEEVEWEKALDVILRTYNYVYEKDGNVIRVTTRDKMQQEPVDTKTFILNYSKASEIMTSVQDILTERGRVKVSERMNMLIVTDIPTNIFHISQVIERLDKMTPQAYIDSKVISTDVGLAENLGIDWNVAGGINSGSSRPTTFPFVSNDGQGVPSTIEQFFPPVAAAAGANALNPRDFPNAAVTATPTGTTYSYGALSFSSFKSVLNMLETNSHTKVVSNPRIVVLNNQEAQVQVGVDYPIPTYERNSTTGTLEVTGYSYKNLGVLMKVTPHINNANEILVDVKPEVSSFGELVDFTTFKAASFNVTNAKTQVMMKSGETIAIGGLLTDNEGTTETKVPYLGDIPLVGKLLFKSKRQTVGSGNDKKETLFFVTVTSVDSHGQPISDSARKDDLSSQDNAPTSDKNNAPKSGASSAAGAQNSAA